MSRLERLPNGHWGEVYDYIPDDCRSCGKPLKPGNISLGVSTCGHHGQQRDFTCRACRTVHVDCPCGTVGPQSLGTQYFAGQHGPTADFGDG